MTVYPSYYKDFKCIADKCRHSCCIGWEISIDKESLEYYSTIGGKIGEKLERCINQTNEYAYFELVEDERCPFLCKNGLCELILNIGEDSLCDICKEHPRFRNYIGQREEVGIGMVCEEAARIIIENDCFVTLSCENDCDNTLTSFEKQLLDMRCEVFSVICDRRYTIKERIAMLEKRFDLYLSERSIVDWTAVFHSLERLSKEWDLFLDKIKDVEEEEYLPEGYDIPFEQILHYFVYRHLISAVDFDDASERLSFAVLSLRMIGAIFRKCIDEKEDLETLIEISRMYSGEIEYSEENTEAILNVLAEYRYE